MRQFPYIPDDLNDLFARERDRWDFRFLRPLIVVGYFFFRAVVFPLKFTIHRTPWPGEAKVIDWWMAFGLKYLATHEAAELFIRHVQIEPLLYRYILQRPLDEASDATNKHATTEHATTGKRETAEHAVDEGTAGGLALAPPKLNTIDGDYTVDDLATVVDHRLTIGHDLLSYEVVDRFDRAAFLANLAAIARTRPDRHDDYGKGVLEANARHSWQLLGPTSVVMLIVTTITIFGSLHTTVTALNSFGSDSLLLWCLKHLYAGDPEALIDLDFFLQDPPNRGHYHNSVFFSNPYQYLYYHVVFDEVAYRMLQERPPVPSGASTR